MLNLIQNNFKCVNNSKRSGNVFDFESELQHKHNNLIISQVEPFNHLNVLERMCFK